MWIRDWPVGKMDGVPVALETVLSTMQVAHLWVAQLPSHTQSMLQGDDRISSTKTDDWVILSVCQYITYVSELWDMSDSMLACKIACALENLALIEQHKYVWSIHELWLYLWDAVQMGQYWLVTSLLLAENVACGLSSAFLNALCESLHWPKPWWAAVSSIYEAIWWLTWHVEYYDLEMVKIMNGQMQEHWCVALSECVILWTAANEYMQGIKGMELLWMKGLKCM